MIVPVLLSPDEETRKNSKEAEIVKIMNSFAALETNEGEGNCEKEVPATSRNLQMEGVSSDSKTVIRVKYW